MAPALQRHAGRWGLLAAVLGLGLACAAFAAVEPVNGSADEPAHVDYAYQLWHGDFPVFEDGLVVVPEGQPSPPVQFVAQHPPLFYLLLAPVVGPLVDAGHPQAAVSAARGVSLSIAVLGLLALAWAAAQLSDRRPWTWAVTSAAVAAPIVPFMRVGGSVYNDNLAVLFAVVALGLTVRILRKGWSPRLLFAVGLACGLGALSRATFVITLVAVTAGLCLAGWRHAQGGSGRRLGVTAGLAVLPIGSALAVAGWFYRRNIELTGTWTGARSDYAQDNLGRTAQPITDVLTSSTYWQIPLDLLRQSPEHLPVLGRVLLLLLLLLALVGWALRRGFRVELGVVALLALQAIGTLALTAGYIGTGGGTAGRYLLPALFPLAAVLAAGVLAVGERVGAAVLLGYGVAAWLPFALWILAQPAGDPGQTSNGVPLLAVWVALVGLGVAVIAQAVAVAGLHGGPAEPTDPARRPRSLATAGRSTA